MNYCMWYFNNKGRDCCNGHGPTSRDLETVDMAASYCVGGGYFFILLKSLSELDILKMELSMALSTGLSADVISVDTRADSSNHWQRSKRR